MLRIKIIEEIKYNAKSKNVFISLEKYFDK